MMPSPDRPDWKTVRERIDLAAVTDRFGRKIPEARRRFARRRLNFGRAVRCHRPTRRREVR